MLIMATPVNTQAADQPKRAASNAKPAAWMVLLGMGGTSITFNIVHAFTTGHMPGVIAVLYGVVPVAAAMGLSHIVAAHNGGWLMKTVTILVMVTAMTLSTVNIAAVVWDSAHDLGFMFGFILDASGLVAISVIFSARKAITPRGSEKITDPELAASSEPELVAGSDPEVPPGTEPGVPPRSSARNQPRKRATASARKPRRTSAPRVPGTPDLDTESWALQILAADPGMSGSELGRRMGKSDRYGRDVIKRLSAPVPDPGPLEAGE